MNTQTLAFLLNADRAWLATCQRRILRGDRHLVAARNQILPIVGRESNLLRKMGKPT